MPRIPIPPSLKRLIVPVWNATYHGAWFSYDYLNALAHRRLERCSVCGRAGLMLYRRRVIPRRLVELWGLSPRLAESLARKESSDCCRCGAKLRCRRLARTLIELYPTGSPVSSLAEWVSRSSTQALRVAEINRIDGVHEQLLRLPQFSSSDFVPGAPAGSMVAGIRCEDLTCLSYADESFDVVLTSETLEHVPDLDRALAEIMRVLVPGGRHIFTIPVLPDTTHTFSRSVIHSDGSIEDRAPRICHPGGDVGYPVFTEFGKDLREVMERAGFEFEVRYGPVRVDDLAQVYVCRRK
jgi:SAM-dependent methyltransferase